MRLHLSPFSRDIRFYGNTTAFPRFFVIRAVLRYHNNNSLNTSTILIDPQSLLPNNVRLSYSTDGCGPVWRDYTYQVEYIWSDGRALRSTPSLKTAKPAVEAAFAGRTASGMSSAGRGITALALAGGRWGAASFLSRARFARALSKPLALCPANWALTLFNRACYR
jgi:hypothetical protein